MANHAIISKLETMAKVCRLAEQQCDQLKEAVLADESIAASLDLLDGFVEHLRNHKEGLWNLLIDLDEEEDV